MSDHSRRVRALGALVMGSSSLVSSSLRARIIEELAEVSRVRTIPAKNRKRLLQVLHSTRALDSTLKEFTAFHGCPTGASLGAYLRALTTHTSSTLASRLATSDRARYQMDIVRPRNRYMHEAGAFPTSDSEVLTLLSDMQDCLNTVLAL